MRPLDTSPDAHAVQLAIYRRLGPGRCAEIALEMSDESRELTRAGIRRRHPGYSDADIEWALRRILFDDDTFRAVWPDARLVEP
jgi:hypothetical protein